MESQPLSAEAKPYVPLATCICPPPVAQLPSPGFFPQPVPYPYQSPPPQAGFLGVSPGCWGIPLGPGGVVIQGAFPHPAWAPPMPPPHGAIATPAETPCAMARATSQGGGKQQPLRSVHTGRVPCTRAPPPPRLDVPPRLHRPAAGRPGPHAASRGSKAGGAGVHGAAKEDPAPRGGKAPGAGEEAAANEPSPRSVLVTTSPPISPTTPVLPSSFDSFPLPCLPPATAALTAPTEPPPHRAEHGTGTMPPGPPKTRRRRGPPRAQPPPGGEARRGAMKPRLLFDPASTRTTLMIRHLPNNFT